MYPFSLSLILQKNRNFTGAVNIPSEHEKSITYIAVCYAFFHRLKIPN